ncbi:MAG: 50S ribosomal protein L11 methyltransferase [Lutibacter sp.]
MDNIYIEYQFEINPLKPGSEILIAELGLAGFESFVETEKGVTAYIQNKDWNPKILDNIYCLNSQEFKITHSFKKIEQVNWNSEWEKNFNPIQVENKVYVRAPFHQPENYPYEIVIEPKMSFGTGHHETTFMMVQHLLNIDLKDKNVLDMGCGTGILAILAEKLGAKTVEAIDNDNWCYVNSIENIHRNQCEKIAVFEGDASLLVHKNYDVIIANINRNILLNDMESYVKSLAKDGILLLSGFYKNDIPIIQKSVEKLGLKLVNTISKNRWVALQYVK